MQCQLTVASVHEYFREGHKQLGHVEASDCCIYAFGKLTASRPVREKQKPRICHGKFTTATNGGPLMEGK